jgi:hypothetical protein
LHADQLLDHLFRGQLLATQQRLSLEQRPVEGARREHGPVGHPIQSSFEIEEIYSGRCTVAAQAFS